jgi:hypothetical protein
VNFSHFPLVLDYGAFSLKAQQELSALPDAYGAAVQSDLDSADQADDPATRSFHLGRARHAADAGGARQLGAEIGQRIRAVSDNAEAYVPDAESADDQSAGTMSAEDVAREVARISQMNTVGFNSNRSDPPKSLAQKNREQDAARPGYSNGQQAPIRA